MDTPTDKPAASTFNPDPFDASNLAASAEDAARPAQGVAAAPAVNHPDDPAWGVLAALGVWFSSVVLLLVGAVPALLIYAAYRMQTMNLEEVMRAAPTDPLLILFSMIVMLPVHLLTFGIGWWLVTGFGKRPFREVVGWDWGGFGFWKCVGLTVALLLVSILLAKLIGGQPTDLERIIESSKAARFCVAFLAVATAPIVEEVIYRGVLYPPLQRALNARAAIVIVSLLFASVHFFQYWNNPGVIVAVTLLSFALTWVRAHTGRLLPCFVIHFLFNGVQAIIIVAEPYLKTLSDAAPEPQKGFLIASLARALGIGL